MAQSVFDARGPGGNSSPFGKCRRAASFVGLAVDNMTFEIKVIVDVGVDGSELLQCFRSLKCKYRSFTSHCGVENVDATFEQQILDVAQRKRIPHTHHNDQAGHLRRRIEIAKLARRLCSRSAAHSQQLSPCCRCCHIGPTRAPLRPYSTGRTLPSLFRPT